MPHTFCPGSAAVSAALRSGNRIEGLSLMFSAEIDTGSRRPAGRRRSQETRLCKKYAALGGTPAFPGGEI